jgi:hypothetical protein
MTLRGAGVTARCCCSASSTRRSELVSLRVEDVAVVAGGLRLRIVRGKTDQAGQGPRSACRGGAMAA